MTNAPDQWPLWEVFVRTKRGLNHQHTGSLYAADAKMALENARDLNTRRQEGISIWVVPATDITASSPEDEGSFFEPGFERCLGDPVDRGGRNILIFVFSGQNIQPIGDHSQCSFLGIFVHHIVLSG